METVKVDVRKLQMLNDRINQCIDALGQVRLSAHGIAHSASPTPTGVNPYTPLQPIGGAGGPVLGGPIGYADPRFTFGLPIVPFGGLGHSAFVPTPPSYAQQLGIPFQAPLGQPFGQLPPSFGLASWSQLGGQSPGFGSGIGLSHTATESDAYARPLWADPWLAARVAQTFPYASQAVPPFLYL